MVEKKEMSTTAARLSDIYATRMKAVGDHFVPSILEEVHRLLVILNTCSVQTPHIPSILKSHLKESLRKTRLGVIDTNP